MSSKKISYTESVEELEKIVRSIEKDELDIDQLSLKIKRAEQLIRQCNDKLKETEGDIQKIINSL